MPKTAAQLVPLRTQLAQSLAIFRFNDTSDLSSALTYVDLPWDNSGGLSGFGLTGQPSPATGTGALPPTTLTPPTNFALTRNDAALTSTAGLNRYHAGQQVWHLAYYDSSNRQSQNIIVTTAIPNDIYTASVTFNLTYPPGAAGVYIYKYLNGNGCFWWQVPNTVSSMTDTSSVYSTSLPTQNGVTTQGYGYPSPNSQSTAPTISQNDFVMSVSNTGGGYRATSYAYALSAYNSLGETTVQAGPQQQIVGPPIINGSASGRMNNITVADGPAGGTLPAGKWYYQVTAYSDSPNERYGSINGIPFQKGAGHNESLPSAEVSITRNAVGQNLITWVPVANAAGYVIHRSRDLPTPVLNAPTTATTGGTLPATTTYYYEITALNAAGFPLTPGETVGSNEVSVTTGATATNTVTLTWAAVQHAYGYRIYRSDTAGGPWTRIATVTSGATTTYVNTAVTPAGAVAAEPPATSTALGAGTCVYVGAVAGQATSSFTDNGSFAPGQNSGFQPPKQYNGTYGVQTVTATWTASANATGYYLYRFGAQTVTNALGGSAKDAPGQATATVTDIADGTWFGRTTPNVNYGQTSTLTAVGRYFQNHAFQTVMRTLGISFIGVAGKRYRFMVHNQSSQITPYTSGYFTVPTSTEYYWEVNPNITLEASQHYWVMVQGEDQSCTVQWRTTPSTLIDFPSAVQQDNGTWVAVRAANQGQFNSSPGMNSLGDGGTRVRVETGGFLPTKVVLRRADAAAAAIGSTGVLLGDGRYARYAFSPNRTYATPIRAIVPNYALNRPSAPTGDNVALASKHAEIAVSTDGGATFTPVQAGVRFVFPTPATQLQWRYTLPEASARMTWDRRLVTAPGVPATDFTFQGQSNFTHLSDSGHNMYNYAVNNSASMHYLKLSGHLSIAHNDNNYIWSNYAFLLNSWNADLSVTGYFDNESNNFGIRFRTQGKAYQGYFFYLDASGNVGLVRQTNDSTTVTNLVIVNNATPPPVRVTTGQNLPQHTYTLRVICVNNHFLCYLNGRLVIDTTDTVYNDSSYGFHGITGARGIITNFTMTALSSPLLTLPWELEYVSAYLEA